MGKHRHGVTGRQRTATFGRRLARGLGRALTYFAVFVFWAAVILGFLALLAGAVLYGMEGR